MAEQLDDLTIRFPARPGYLSISRLNATAMAAAAGFDVDELDDLRLAIDEAVTWLLTDDLTAGDHAAGGDDSAEAQPDDSVELAISCRGPRLDVRGQRSRNGLEAPDPGDLVHAILGATVDSYETGVDDDGRRFIALVKQTAHDG